MKNYFAADEKFQSERELVHDECGWYWNKWKPCYPMNLIEGMYRNGTEGIIQGCTEIALLVHEKDSHIPLFDTTQIHAQAAVEFSLKV